MLLLTVKKPAKMTAVFFVALFAALAFQAFAPAGTASAAPSSGIAYVDMATLMGNHPDGAEFEKTMRALADEVQKEFTAKSAGMNEQDKAILYNQLQQRIDAKGFELTSAIRVKVAAAVAQVAEQKGFSVVFEKGVPIYGGEDITAEVGRKIAGQ